MIITQGFIVFFKKECVNRATFILIELICLQQSVVYEDINELNFLLNWKREQLFNKRIQDYKVLGFLWNGTKPSQ